MMNVTTTATTMMIRRYDDEGTSQAYGYAAPYGPQTPHEALWGHPPRGENDLRPAGCKHGPPYPNTRSTQRAETKSQDGEPPGKDYP